MSGALGSGTSGIKTQTATPATTSRIQWVQSLINIMDTMLKSYFPTLNSAPNALYIMMATMGLESSFRMVFGTGTAANGVVVSSSPGTDGYKYVTDPLVRPLYLSPSTQVPVTTTPILNLGLQAMACMQVMGWYHIQGTKNSKNILGSTQYAALSASSGLLVPAGSDITAIYTNDAAGATRSIIAGCMVMENKYMAYKPYNTPQQALRLASGGYLGIGRDSLGTSTQDRISAVFNSNTDVAKTLAAAGLTTSVNSSPKVYFTLPPPSISGGGTGKLPGAAAPAAVPSNGCSMGGVPNNSTGIIPGGM